MERTEHYQLCLWEKDDPVLRSDFNENNEKLEKALTGLPKIIHGTYTGVGGYGPDHPCTIEFPFKPLMVIFCAANTPSYTCGFVWPYGAERGIILVENNEHYKVYLSWTDNSVSWYMNGGNSNLQMNITGYEYHYIAIGVQE